MSSHREIIDSFCSWQDQSIDWEYAKAAGIRLFSESCKIDDFTSQSYFVAYTVRTRNGVTVIEGALGDDGSHTYVRLLHREATNEVVVDSRYHVREIDAAKKALFQPYEVIGTKDTEAFNMLSSPTGMPYFRFYPPRYTRYDDGMPIPALVSMVFEIYDGAKRDDPRLPRILVPADFMK
jgi:hypothetical protein